MPYSSCLVGSGRIDSFAIHIYCSRFFGLHILKQIFVSSYQFLVWIECERSSACANVNHRMHRFASCICGVWLRLGLACVILSNFMYERVCRRLHDSDDRSVLYQTRKPRKCLLSNERSLYVSNACDSPLPHTRTVTISRLLVSLSTCLLVYLSPCSLVSLSPCFLVSLSIEKTYTEWPSTAY